MDTVTNPARGPKWCDRARQNHDLCEEREQHQSKWFRACSTQELDRYRLRLAQITPTDGAPITFTELEITREGEVLELLMLLGSARIMASTLRRLVELDRQERAR